MNVITTILPIFVMIILGLIARKRGFITPDFQGPANKLVFYLSIPAMIFSAISKASFGEQFNPAILLLTLGCAFLSYLGTYGLTRLLKIPAAKAGPLIQCSGHGNLGYIGLPITLLYLGETGLARGAILAGFLMILQHVVSIFFLQLHNGANRQLSARTIGKGICTNPVIIAAMAGIVVSALRIPIPLVVQRSIGLLADLAPPMALLLIGASLSMKLMRKHLALSMLPVLFKLLLLPALGALLAVIFQFSTEDFLPALILLASPTATVAFVMAREMGGDAELSVAVISISTLLSSCTFILWLTLFS